MLNEYSIIPDWLKLLLPIRNQGKKNNCTSHAIAGAVEIMLSKELGELAIVDADDLWEKQLNFGTATQKGDTISGAIHIAKKYGLKYKTASGKTGVIYPEFKKLS